MLARRQLQGLRTMLRAPSNSRLAKQGFRQQRGLSLVELLVGAALGLFLVGGAISLFVGNLDSSRRLLIEARVNQDLRTAADLIARDLRRAGYWAEAIKGVAAAPMPNPHKAIAGTYGVADSEITYSFARNGNSSVENNEQFGFKLYRGAIRMRTDGTQWQSITDPDVITVTALEITASETPVALGDACAKVCPPPTGATYTCPDPPTLILRRYDILLQANAAGPGNAAITRQLRESVRVRNDQFAGECPV
ncbi:MAG: prepilin-type N-terminal cleavage/methylation domain-containing protein [Methylibium sp.]|uniref:PilW family protein n=1 Tax=Methylibium sp. TaxID=2067992 RepID=UPI0017C7C619|nr:prepilin-type N-terminal cleavage/methylation domain-containing protein [Methylibium sp.]MBA3597806.1 prepilin-type N-terminal cleavage/methylation domain-containing protein [Methylibium sp.]